QAEINSCVLAFGDKPYLPATAIKGCIRAWLEARNASRATKLFGAPNEKTGEAGIAEFGNAWLQENVVSHPPPYWDSDKCTGVEASVAIDRDTRSAAYRKLFHAEVVPPGARFGLEILVEADDGAAIEELLAGLNGFNDTADPITLGAGTAS